MATVEVRNGNIDGALKRFKMQVAKDGIPSEIKKRKHYEKPGVKKRNESPYKSRAIWDREFGDRSNYRDVIAYRSTQK